MADELELIELTVEIMPESGMNNDELDQTTRRMLSEIRESEVESAELAFGSSSPDGAKSFTLLTTLGVLAVKTLPQHLPKLIDLLKNLMLRQRPIVKATVKNGSREVSVEFTPSETTNEQLSKILDILNEHVGEEKRIILQ